MKKIKRHLVFFICYFLYEYTVDLVLAPEITFVEELIFFLTQNVFLFYGFLFCLNRFNKEPRFSLYLRITPFIIVILAFLALRYTVRYQFLAVFFQKEYGDLPLKNWLITCIVWLINCFLYAFAYFYFNASIKKQETLRRNQEEKLLASQEKLRLENMFLKAQIHPHFLYNTLSFLYSKSLPLSAPLSNGILKLSDIMRYSLQDYDDQGTVALSDEIIHVQNIIDINQLRFNNELYLDCKTDQITNDIRIIPLVLLTLTENVIKHGELRDKDEPAKIEVTLCPDGALCLFSSNKKRTGPKEASNGIGLLNTTKRLEYAYGERCVVQKKDTASHFSISITIKLNKDKKTIGHDKMPGRR